MDVIVYKDAGGILHFATEEVDESQLQQWEKIGTSELPLNEEEESPA